MDNDLISRSALLKDREYCDCPSCEDGGDCGFCYIPVEAVKNAPAVDAVSRAVFEQIYWERNQAIEQLRDYDIPFGGIAPDVVKVVRCKDCKHFEIDEGDFLGLCKCGSIDTNHGGEIYPEEDFFCAYGERR